MAIHKTSTQSHTPIGGTPTTIGEWSCQNCHKSHGGSGVPYLLEGNEEQDCYSSGCHGNISTGANTKNIEGEFGKLYVHPTHAATGKRKNPDDPTNLNVPNRHAECQNCHSPHQAQKELHSTGSNSISQVLSGVWGVLPGASRRPLPGSSLRFRRTRCV